MLFRRHHALNPASNRPRSSVAITPPRKIIIGHWRGSTLRPMFKPEIIQYYYSITPIYFWPILWLELRAMGRYLSHIMETGEEIDGMLCLSRYGTFYIIDMSDEANGYVDLDAWRPNYNAIPNTLEAHLRRIPEPQPSAFMRLIQGLLNRRSWPTPGVQNLGMETAYLDPG